MHAIAAYHRRTSSEGSKPKATARLFANFLQLSATVRGLIQVGKSKIESISQENKERYPYFYYVD